MYTVFDLPEDENKKANGNLTEQMSLGESGSLLRGMLESIPNSVAGAHHSALYNSLEPRHFQRDLQSPSTLTHPIANNDMKYSSQLFGDFPEDSFEPVPIRPSNDRTDGSSVLELVLDHALDAVDNSCFIFHNEGAFELDESYFTPTDVFDLDPVPVQEEAAITPFPFFGESFRVHGHLHEDSSSLYNSMNKRAHPDPIVQKAKKRRTFNDADPCARGYQEQQWLEQFEGLLKFKEQHGHCLVPHTYPENQVLARWVKRQRYQYKLKMAGKQSTITDSRIKELEDIGFVWDSHAVTWNKRFKELQEYREKHGDCNVPSNYPENQNLAVWIKCQRRQFKLFWAHNKSSSMTVDRMRKLNELGFIWNFRPGLDSLIQKQ